MNFLIYIISLFFLVVSITADKFVNKGPDRPAFNEVDRSDSLSAIKDVDYVVINKDLEKCIKDIEFIIDQHRKRLIN